MVRQPTLPVDHVVRLSSGTIADKEFISPRCGTASILQIQGRPVIGTAPAVPIAFQAADTAFASASH
jgi:hypothetical protein